MQPLLPSSISSEYNLRGEMFRSVRSRTERLHNSFFASCVRLWNDLDPAITASPTLHIFAYSM